MRPGHLRTVCGSGEIDDITGLDLALVLKHSVSCPISHAAYEVVERFVSEHPEIPAFLIPIQTQARASRRIEHLTGILHQSPQVLILRRGKVISVQSHWTITAERLRAASLT